MLKISHLSRDVEMYRYNNKLDEIASSLDMRLRWVSVFIAVARPVRVLDLLSAKGRQWSVSIVLCLFVPKKSLRCLALLDLDMRSPNDLLCERVQNVSMLQQEFVSISGSLSAL